MAGWARDAAAYRERCAPRSISYGPGRRNTIDLFPGDDEGPIVVFIHGGYWQALDGSFFSHLAGGLNAHGVSVAVPSYDLCPDVTVDQIVQQMRTASRELARLGRRLVISGHSAGGHLSAMCLETRWDEDYGLARDPLAAALLVSGVYDIEPLRHSYLQPTIQLDDGIVRRNSPLFAVRPCATPVLVTWGAEESEEFARQSISFHAAWQAAGNRAELLAQPGAHHFSAIDGFADPGHPLCRWLAGRLLTSP